MYIVDIDMPIRRKTSRLSINVIKIGELKRDQYFSTSQNCIFILFFLVNLRNETLNEVPNLVTSPDCLFPWKNPLKIL